MGVADKPTKRREAALLAGTLRGATWLGSEGDFSPFVFLLTGFLAADFFSVVFFFPNIQPLPDVSLEEGSKYVLN